MLSPEQIKATDARGAQMDLLQSEMVALLERMKPAMLSAQGSEPDHGALLGDVVAVLANVAVGQVEQRMWLKGESLNKVEAAGGASRLLTEACKRVARYSQTPSGKAENAARQ